MSEPVSAEVDLEPGSAGPDASEAGAGKAGAVDEVPLLARVVATLQEHGRVVRTDWDILTVEVSPDGDGEPPVGVVLPHSQRVVFYSVLPRPVPEDRIAAVSELAHRLNTDLYTACWEFNVDTGLLSVRSGFEFDSVVSLSAAQRAAVIWNCLLEVEMVADEHRPALDAVLAGTPPLDALALIAE